MSLRSSLKLGPRGRFYRKQEKIALKQLPTSETLSSSLSDESDIYRRCSEYVSVSDLAGLELEVEWGVDGKFPISWWTFTLPILGLSVVDPCATFCIFAFHSNKLQRNFSTVFLKLTARTIFHIRYINFIAVAIFKYGVRCNEFRTVDSPFSTSSVPGIQNSLRLHR